jgi:2-polyprenyl-3-methyl-5-hydroxy-6-metoxy-1,4-benzoquinol methylase
MSNNTPPHTIDEVENYWDKRPCNIKHSNAEVGTREYFNEVERRKYFVEPHIIDFANFDSWDGKQVLEVGCGIGTDAVNFARNGAVYTGIELSNESLTLAKKRFELFGLSGNFLKGNAEELYKVLGETKYDLIYSFGVLHHTPDLSLALKQIRNYCHEKSKVKIMVYASNSYKQKMIEAGLDQPEAQYGCPIANTYEKDEITEILKESGFKVTSVYQSHIFPYQVEAYKNYKYSKQPWFEKMPEEVFEVLEKNFGWHLLIDAEPI